MSRYYYFAITCAVAAFFLVMTGFVVYEASISPPSVDVSIVEPSVSQSIVKITSAYGQGSGVIVERSEGFITILTAGHCLTDPDSVPIFTITTDCGFSATIPVDSIYVDKTVDLAVCRVPIPEDESFALSAVPMGQGIDCGELVTVIGYGFFGEKITTKCYVAMPSEKGRLVLDGTINPGNSGCPVLNDNNEIVGVVVIKVWGMGFEGIGITHSVDICKNVLERYRILQGAG